MDCKTCSKCGATWMGGKLFWQTGKAGEEVDLAGLVCNQLASEDTELCINPQRGASGGQTWEYRRGFIDGLTQEMKRKTGGQDYDI